MFCSIIGFFNVKSKDQVADGIDMYSLEILASWPELPFKRKANGPIALSDWSIGFWSWFAGCVWLCVAVENQ